MTQRILQARKPLLILAAIAGLLLIPTRTPAEPVAGKKQDGLVAKMVCYFVQKVHLKRPALDQELSEQLFHRSASGVTRLSFPTRADNPVENYSRVVRSVAGRAMRSRLGVSTWSTTP